MSKLERFAKGEIVLHTPTQDIYDKLMKWCDLQGIKWPSGKKASDLNVWNRYKELTCIVKGHTYTSYRSNNLEWWEKSSFLNEGYKVETLSLTDFKEKQKQNNFRVEIYFDGNDTHAWLIKNDEPVKEAVATCHPKDKFSMTVGSQLALARLFEKKQKENTIDRFVDFLLSFGEHITKARVEKKVNEVKRNAEGGEWVKVVNLFCAADYEINDIFQATSSNRWGWIRIIDNVGVENSLSPGEYVVLENYGPKVHGNE